MSLLALVDQPTLGLVLVPLVLMPWVLVILLVNLS